MFRVNLKYILFLLNFALIANCGGGGGSGQSDIGTAPQISNLTLSRTSVPYLDGDGTTDITGQFDYIDPDLDITSVRIEVSDGTSLSIDVPNPLPAGTGTLIGQFTISTSQLGDFTADVWAEDANGNTSNRLSTTFSVVVDTNTWYERESGLVSELMSVVWNGSLFVAVGIYGAVMTSPDGVAWTVRDSGTNAGLNRAHWDGTHFYVVGDQSTILRSSDGISWTTVNTGADVQLKGIASSGLIFVAGGRVSGSGDAYILTSMDGETWVENNSIPQSGKSVSGIAWSGQQFVASLSINLFPNDGRVLVSVDGITWIEVVISNDSLSTLSIIWDGNQFVAGGVVGRLHMSPDGVNWMEHDTGTSTNYFDIASSGKILIAHGNGTGVATTDNGATWQTFSIGSFYTGHGLAWGNNKFTSVGYIGPGQGGAIFATR